MELTNNGGRRESRTPSTRRYACFRGEWTCPCTNPSMAVGTGFEPACAGVTNASPLSKRGRYHSAHPTMSHKRPIECLSGTSLCQTNLGGEYPIRTDGPRRAVCLANRWDRPLPQLTVPEYLFRTVPSDAQASRHGILRTPRAPIPYRRLARVLQTSWCPRPGSNRHDR